MESITKPLKPNPTGSDPRYGDDFFFIKQELEKLTNPNYADIQQRCQNILTNTAKDLRVMSYLVLATLYVEDVTAFIKNLQTYQILIKNFWPKIHPKREAARLAALQWLNNQRILGYFQNQQNINIEELTAAIKDFNKTLKKYAGKNAPQFSILNELLTKPPTIAAPVPEPIPVTPIKNETTINIQENCRQIINYYLDNANYLAAAAHARALRWSDINLPPHANHKTAIEPLRKEALQKLTPLLTTDNHQEIYLYCEELFLEPGGQFLLDLQYYAHKAAKAMENQELATLLAIQVNSLVQRFPKLPELQFKNGSAFANQQTKDWLLTPATNNINDHIREQIQQKINELKELICS